MALDGGLREDSAVLFTQAPMPHLVINEVLANPIGPEPHQEWVELYNDGAVAAELADFALCDIGGEAWLPEAVLEPGPVCFDRKGHLRRQR